MIKAWTVTWIITFTLGLITLGVALFLPIIARHAYQAHIWEDMYGVYFLSGLEILIGFIGIVCTAKKSD